MSQTLDSAVNRANEILREATETYDFEKIFASVSGGADSTTTLDVAHKSPSIELDGIVYIDTGISVPETKEYVRKQADKRDLEFHVVDSDYRKPHEEYEVLVITYGFPGSKIHTAMWANLKDKPLNRWAKQFDCNIALLSGVNKYESAERMENIGDDPIEEKSNWTYISPLYDWLPATFSEYREEHDLNINDVTEQLRGSSGDCLCAAFGGRKELLEIKIFYPEVFEEINRLERLVARQVQLGKIPEEYALWGHSRTGEDQISNVTDPDQMLMCSGCTTDGCEVNTDEIYDKTGDSLLSKGEYYLTNQDPIASQPNELYCPECDAIIADGQQHREEYHPNAGTGKDDPGIRMIPSRCGDVSNIRITEGKQSTKNPFGKTCGYGNHKWEDYNSPNDIARRQCDSCGAFKVAVTIPEPTDFEHVVAMPTPESNYLTDPPEDDDNDNSDDKLDPERAEKHTQHRINNRSISDWAEGD